ncbi:nucleoside deaminase [Candidatus Kaiserbacteria bacterium]|nr:nucleoside deaminase [Candidatus Kaiserbacteria bacterium]
MFSDEKGMLIAIEEARFAKESGEWPFGAAIFSGDKLVARNRRRETEEKTVLAHAELHTINDACKALGRTNLSDCVIYTTNEPCLMCAAAIFQAKISRVVIGLDRADLLHLLRDRKFNIEHLAEDSGYEPKIVRGVLKERILELFADVQK